MATREVSRLYRHLLVRLGPQGWWPGDTAFEIALGAILTQNTAWRNVEQALHRLRQRGWLQASALAHAPRHELEALLRPTGYFRQKAERVQRFAQWWLNQGGEAGLRLRPLDELRRELLALKGIGPETADSILLYAFHRPILVVDAYTRRILERHGLPIPRDYEGLRRFLEQRLPRDVAVYQEFHALMVAVGKLFCRAQPRCTGCPVQEVWGPPQGI